MTTRANPVKGSHSDPDVGPEVLLLEPATRQVWEPIYGWPLAEHDLAEIEGNLFRFIDLLASINGSILGAPDLSTCDGDEAA